MKFNKKLGGIKINKDKISVVVPSSKTKKYENPHTSNAAFVPMWLLRRIRQQRNIARNPDSDQVSSAFYVRTKEKNED